MVESLTSECFEDCLIEADIVGTRESIDNCAGNPCDDAGDAASTCVDAVNAHTCTCSAGYVDVAGRCEKSSCTHDSCKLWAESSDFESGFCQEPQGHCAALVESTLLEDCNSVCAKHGLYCKADDEGYYWVSGYSRYGEPCVQLGDEILLDCNEAPQPTALCGIGNKDTAEFSRVECWCHDAAVGSD